MTPHTASAPPAPTAVGRRPQLAAFRARLERLAGHPFTGSADLHAFSVAHYRLFWRTFLDWADLLWDGDPDPVCTEDDVHGARFFPGLRLNYAENLLRPLPDAPDGAPALTSVHADGSVERWSRGELRTAVARTAAALRELGLGPGDRVVAIAPNHGGTVVTGLAVSAIGAMLSTATPDMGAVALLGRFGQVEPRTLVVDRTGMARDGSTADTVLTALLDGLPTVKRVLVLDGDPLPDLPVTTARLADLAEAADEAAGLDWPRLPVDHPLWVMFSSGTTGPPKAMVHGAGGSLLEHVKEHRLHGDLRAGDTLYFHTTTAWMMWNWQLSALAVGAHIVVYDGPVRGPETLWELVAAHGVTVFGTSPAYLQLCQDEGYRPRDLLDLGALRAVLSTGAVLHPWQFDWVTDAAAPVPVQSISGGTDIVGCFVLGHPEVPVRAGRCQSLSLGLDVAALGEDGRPVRGRPGELVCRNPFPSRPVGFLADPDGARFRAAYFAAHPGVWTHGDMIEIDADGSARMLGRSDGVLNIDGIRIGPSEIYTIVRGLPEIADAMAVEQADPSRPGGSRLVLLVVLRPEVELDDELVRRIRATLRTQGSAAHVPSVVLPVPELPTTHNGKLSERAARDALDGRGAQNLGALRNPASLVAIRAAAEAAARTAGAGAADRTPGPAAVDRPAGTVEQVFREVLGVDVDPTTSFFDAGGTSRQSMTLLRRLRVELGRPIGMDAFLAAPTVEGVLRALADPAQDEPAVHVLRPGDPAAVPLYLVHGAYGDTDSFQFLLDELDLPCPVYGLRATLTDEDGDRRSVVDVATGHVRALTAAQAEGPLALAGFSFGGLVSFEMARQLTAAGRVVVFLGLLDVRPPVAGLNRAERLVKRVAAVLATLTPGLRVRSPGQAIADVVRRAPRSFEAAEEAAAAGVYEQYRWGPYAGRTTFFRSARRIPVAEHFMYAWRRVVPDLTVVDSPGAHHDMLSRANSVVLARELSRAIRSATG